LNSLRLALIGLVLAVVGACGSLFGVPAQNGASPPGTKSDDSPLVRGAADAGAGAQAIAPFIPQPWGGILELLGVTVAGAAAEAARRAHKRLDDAAPADGSAGAAPAAAGPTGASLPGPARPN
jgi:hypothetical protein